MWNTKQQKGNEHERDEYKHDLVIHHSSRSVKKFNVADSYLRRLFGEFPSVITGIGCVVACFIGYYSYKTANKHSTPISVGSTVINAVIIIILNQVYRKVAIALTNWENHRFPDDWENSMVTKNFSF